MDGNIANRNGDDLELAEWLTSLEAVTVHAGESRARELLEALKKRAGELGVYPQVLPYVPYRNSIPLSKQPPFPGNLELEERITSIIRWKALAMVVRADRWFAVKFRALTSSGQCR